MNEFHASLWAPWRHDYVTTPSPPPDGPCFLCAYLEKPDADAENGVIWRSDETIVLLNRYPYTNGHLLIAPAAHKADLDDLTPGEMQRLWHHTGQAKRLLAGALQPNGFNIGVNLGRCAGAGLPGHVHVHVVPRWNGDTNFMSVVGDVRVIPQSLDQLQATFTAKAAEMGLPAPADEGAP